MATEIRRGRLSPVDAVDIALRRCQEVSPTLNPFTTVLDESARADAREAERAITAGYQHGPLHGVPIAVKDAIWVRDAPATLGSRALAEFIAPEDAIVVKRLRAAGAIVVAKTTCSELLWAMHGCSDLFGITRNPRNTRYSPGGSSGGSAAVVAAGVVPLALGSDAGGSIRVPASFCGIVGVKPSRGRVPLTPGFGETATTNTFGPLARSVRDAALCLQVIADPSSGDGELGDPPRTAEKLGGPRIRVEDLRVACSLGSDQSEVGLTVSRLFDASVADLRRRGWTLQYATPELPDLARHLDALYLGEMSGLVEGRKDQLGELAHDLMDRADMISAERVVEARSALAAYTSVWDTFFMRFDLLLTPTSPIEPFQADPRNGVRLGQRTINIERDAWWQLPAMANLAGGPSVSVPAGTFANGLPFGLMLTGPRGQDDLCLAAAQAICDR
jgi:Asp-tRNA(Asn)/Glu-tRNA(Gln) amidotransferase A subunit family amidase